MKIAELFAIPLGVLLLPFDPASAMAQVSRDLLVDLPGWSSGTRPDQLINVQDDAGRTAAMPDDVTPPDLQGWGLVFLGGRRIVADGKPGFQFAYVTDQREVGPITLFVTNTAEPDGEMRFDQSDHVNRLSWRSGSQEWSIVGRADKGWMWSLKNEITYQMEAR